MLSAVLLPLLLFQLSTAQSTEPISLTCKHPKATICVIHDVTDKSILDFPSISEKHTLQIRSGNLTRFSKEIGSNLGNVKKLIISRIGIKSLWVSPTLQTLNAESNQIHELEVEFVEAPVEEKATVNLPEDGASATEIPKVPLTTTKISKTDEEDVAEESIAKIPDAEDETTVNAADAIATTETPGADAGTLVNAGDTIATTKAPDTKDNTSDIPKPEPDAPDTKATFRRSITAVTSTKTSASAYKLEILNLANNQLKSILDIKPLINLKELCLDGNLLETVAMDVFADMKNLKKLSLAKNKITSVVTASVPLDLPSLEWLSLASNQLTKLQVANWAMPQLNELHLSSNKLVALDITSFTRFISLETLAIGENAWNCFWLRDSLGEIDGKLAVNLLDREEDCPSSSALPIHDTCCSMTMATATSEESQLDSAEQTGRISNLAESITRMKDDMERQVKKYNQQLETEWKRIDKVLKGKEEQLRKLAEEQKDDARVTDVDLEELQKLIAETQDSLTRFGSLRTEYGKFEQSFTHLWHVVLAQKNKLLAGMRNAEKLREEMKQFETSFDARVN